VCGGAGGASGAIWGDGVLWGDACGGGAGSGRWVRDFGEERKLLDWGVGGGGGYGADSSGGATGVFL